MTETESEDSCIAKWFEGRSVFITGATGFIGKCLIEKLLRSCPGIDKIFMLMRDGKNLNARERLQNFSNLALFQRVKQMDVSLFEKLVLIEGDISKPELGINEYTKKTLSNVSVVLHSAASIRFDNTMKVAMSANLIGTMNLIALCKDLPKMEVFVYVSTIYSNFEQKHILEEIYPMPDEPQKVIDLMDTMTDDEICSRLLKEKENTYVYSKAMTECFLNSLDTDFYIACVRPSIVSATWRDPIPGWLDNKNGAFFYFTLIGKGLLRIILMRKHNSLDLVPVDLVANTIIAAAWYTALEKKKKFTVFNYASSTENPLVNKDITSLCVKYTRKHPFNNVIWYPVFYVIQNRFIYKCAWFLVHTIPAHLMDLLQMMTMNKQRTSMVSLYKKINKTCNITNYAIYDQLNFEISNVQKLQNKLSRTDKAIFQTDVRDIEWESYIETNIKGIRKHLLGESESSKESAKRRMKILFIIHEALKLSSIIVASALMLYSLYFCYLSFNMF